MNINVLLSNHRQQHPSQSNVKSQQQQLVKQEPHRYNDLEQISANSNNGSNGIQNGTNIGGYTGSLCNRDTDKKYDNEEDKSSYDIRAHREYSYYKTEFRTLSRSVQYEQLGAQRSISVLNV